MEFNTIVYIVREGYEIKTWLNVPNGTSDEEIEKMAIEKFKSVGVEVKEDDTFEYEEM